MVLGVELITSLGLILVSFYAAWRRPTATVQLEAVSELGKGLSPILDRLVTPDSRHSSLRRPDGFEPSGMLPKLHYVALMGQMLEMAISSGHQRPLAQ